MGVALAGLFLAIYLPTIQCEESYLREHFAGFEAYAAKVPRLLPRLTPAASNGGSGEFSGELYLHHREYNASIGAAAIYLALALRLLLSEPVRQAGPIPWIVSDLCRDDD